MITTYINYELHDFSETVENSSLIWESNALGNNIYTREKGGRREKRCRSIKEIGL